MAWKRSVGRLIPEGSPKRHYFNIPLAIKSHTEGHRKLDRNRHLPTLKPANLCYRFNLVSFADTNFIYRQKEGRFQQH